MHPSPLRRPFQVCLIVIALLMAALGLLSNGSSLAHQIADDLDISSKRFIVINAETGEVIAEQNADERVAIASLTKVFTAIEALERGDLDQVITTKSTDLYDASSSLMGFGPNETFTLEDLLYGMMLPSGNDAAHAIARALGETPESTDEEAYDTFVSWMNERVTNMGLENTQFMNPHGWGVEGHYSTARDVATFMMYAMQYPTFRDLISTSNFTTSNGQYNLANNNRLLNMGYEGLIGGKTGFDNDSGWCLIEVAERDGTTLITVTLDGLAPDVWYQDNIDLLDLGFAYTAQRGADDSSTQGQFLSYRDPDAASILASVRSGASLGQATGGAAQSQNPSVAGQAAVTANQEEPESSIASATNQPADAGSGGRSGILAVIGVACLIAAVAAFKAFGYKILAGRHQTP